MDDLLFVSSFFPIDSIKHSYEKQVLKKSLTSDYIFAIPFGIKYFLWFTKKENKECTFLICFDRDSKQVKKINSIQFHATADLYKNTIVYGTLLSFQGNDFFSIENIMWYKGDNCCEFNWETKYSFIENMLTKDVSYKKNTTLTLGLPVFDSSVEGLEKKVQKNNVYRTYSYAYRLKNKNNSLVFVLSSQKQGSILEKRKQESCFDQEDILNIVMNPQKKKSAEVEEKNIVVLKENPIPKKEYHNKVYPKLLKPDLQDDIYHVYSLDKRNLNAYEGIALISNYETSVMLNNVFRTIKENKNLDALEESDDEEEFENNQEDKFVNLKKEAIFYCVFHSKFKKWIPTEEKLIS